MQDDGASRQFRVLYRIGGVFDLRDAPVFAKMTVSESGIELKGPDPVSLAWSEIASVKAVHPQSTLLSLTLMISPKQGAVIHVVAARWILFNFFVIGAYVRTYEAYRMIQTYLHPEKVPGADE